MAYLTPQERRRRRAAVRRAPRPAPQPRPVMAGAPDAGDDTGAED